MSTAGPRLAEHDSRGLDQPGLQDDIILIRQSLTSPECFAVLFDRHAPAVHRYVARRLGPDAAEDVVSETFLTAFRQRASFDPVRADTRPWLYGIATNLISRHRRDEIRFLRAIARAGTTAPPVVASDEEITSRVAAQSVRRQLAAALARLSPAQRDVLVLVASGLTLPEVAAALGVPAGTVASRLARARQAVRAALGGSNPAAADQGNLTAGVRR